MPNMYGDGMTDEEYQDYLYSLPRWQRNLLFTLAIAPFAFITVMIPLGMSGVLNN
jgi:hypothetical protein